LIQQDRGTALSKRKPLLAIAVVVFAGLVGLIYHLFLGNTVEKSIVKREALISEMASEEWVYPPYQLGMDGIEAVPPEGRVMGSIPPIDGIVPIEFKEGLFDETVESSNSRIVGFVRYPDRMAFNDVPMCYLGYSGEGKLRWMMHQNVYNGTISVGTFSQGIPEDGLFLFDWDIGKIIAKPDISVYFEGRDLPPSLGIVELINGKVVGMITLRDEASAKVIGQYLATKPRIQDSLQE